jgi:KipI family sensor histidine kinase inhibitor
MIIPRFLHLGDRAMTLEFGDRIDQQLVSTVAALDARLIQEIAAGRLTGVIETVPTFRSLTVIFDPLVLPRAVLQDRLMAVLNETETSARKSSRHWCLPVYYGGEYGPDLKTVAQSKGLTPEKVIELHVSQLYLVYMIGFLPGFPFMGDVVSALDMPRLQEPRVRVPAGSVAITGKQTAIYPWESPGGWQLLGRCPLTLFDAGRPEPALLAPGDRVSFQSVSIERYQELLKLTQGGALNFSQFLLEEVST